MSVTNMDSLGILPCSCFLELHWSNKCKRKFSWKITSRLRLCWDCVPVMSKIFKKKKIRQTLHVLVGNCVPGVSVTNTGTLGILPCSCFQVLHHLWKLSQSAGRLLKRILTYYKGKGFKKLRKLKILVFKSYIEIFFLLSRGEGEIWTSDFCFMRHST